MTLIGWYGSSSISATTSSKVYYGGPLGASTSKIYNFWVVQW